MPLTSRLTSTEKYWLKRARVPVDRLAGADPGLAAGIDGTALADLRVEEGMLRAVLPAGAAPCCARGLDLERALVLPLDEGGVIGPDRPADLLIERGPMGRVRLRRGAAEEACGLGLECVCIPTQTSYDI